MVRPDDDAERPDDRRIRCGQVVCECCHREFDCDSDVCVYLRFPASSMGVPERATGRIRPKLGDSQAEDDILGNGHRRNGDLDHWFHLVESIFLVLWMEAALLDQRGVKCPVIVWRSPELSQRQSSPSQQPSSLLQTSESLPDQVLWDIKRPEALHRSAPIGDFQVADAMEFLFGKYDSQGRSSKWTGIKSHALGFQADTGTTSPYFDAEYNEGGVLKHVLLTATTPDVYFYGCHLCSPLISIFVFANRDGKWIPEREAHVENLSSWGKPPAVKLQRIGAEEYGVVFSTDDLAQGQYSAEDILMVPRTASSVELLKIITKASNNGACGGEIRCYLEYSTYRFEPNHDHKLFDVIVTESGTKWKDRTVVPADGIAHYEYRNGEYVVTQSPTELVPDDKSGQPIGAGRVTVDCSAGKLDGLTIYAGPQSSFPVVGRVTCDEVVTVLSPKDDNDWFRIRTSSNVVGFVWMFLKASGS